MLRVAKKKYYQSQFEATFKDIKGTWKVIRSVFSSTSNMSNIRNLKINDEIVEDKKVIVEKFNDFFSNIGPNLSKDIPVCHKSFCEFLNEPAQESLFLIPTNKEEILCIVNSLKNKKSPGCDNIGNELLKRNIRNSSTTCSYF